jgi:hypothetical protein
LEGWIEGKLEEVKEDDGGRSRGEYRKLQGIIGSWRKKEEAVGKIEKVAEHDRESCRGR